MTCISSRGGAASCNMADAQTYRSSGPTRSVRRQRTCVYGSLRPLQTGLVLQNTPSGLLSFDAPPRVPLLVAWVLLPFPSSVRRMRRARGALRTVESSVAAALLSEAWSFISKNKPYELASHTVEGVRRSCARQTSLLHPPSAGWETTTESPLLIRFGQKHLERCRSAAIGFSTSWSCKYWWAWAGLGSDPVICYCGMAYNAEYSDALALWITLWQHSLHFRLTSDGTCTWLCVRTSLMEWPAMETKWILRYKQDLNDLSQIWNHVMTERLIPTR